jgi:hypothetical protein
VSKNSLVVHPDRLIGQALVLPVEGAAGQPLDGHGAVNAYLEVRALAQLLEWLIENYDYAVAYMSGLYSYAVRTQWIRMARRHLQLYRRLASATAA